MYGVCSENRPKILMVEFFRRWRPPNRINVSDRHDRFRGSPRERGYDEAWSRLSAAYRRDNPFCEKCEQDGRIELAVLVDHMIPVRHSEERRLDRENLWSLCSQCHGWKYRLERYAEAAHKVGHLIEWCRHPEKRPKSLRGTR